MAFTCEFESNPIPSKESEIATVTMTAKVIVKFLLRPIPTSPIKKRARICLP